MKTFAIGIALLLVTGIAVFMALTAPAVWDFTHPIRDVPDASAPDLANGKAMFAAGDCAVCHASLAPTGAKPADAKAAEVKTADLKTADVKTADSKAADLKTDIPLLGGGRSLSSAFGVFYMPNISPDKQDGIGNWTTPQFIRAMREGVSPHGENEYPVLPYTSYQRMTANDIRDLLAYIDTLPPVPGRIRDHDLKFPFTMRRGVGLWRLMFLDGRPLAPEPQQSAAWTRGRYLVEGPAHCAECHSPRNFMGAIVSGKRFAGGLDPEGKSYIPNITPDETGIGYWSKSEIASYLKTGVSPINIKAGDDMAAVIVDTSTLSDDDRLAIGEYMKSLPAVDAPDAGLTEPNRTALIRMLPKTDGNAAQSGLSSLTAVPADQIAKAATLYAVKTQPFSLDRATAGASAQDGKVLGSAKLTVLARDGGMVQVRIDGWQQQGSDSAFYALQGQRILEAVLAPSAVAKVVRTRTVHDAATSLDWYQGSLTVWVQPAGLNTDLASLWTYGHDLYGASCASCHSLQPSGNFLANQWIGSLGAMKRYTSLDDDQYRLLLAYLQYHSKDVGADTPALKTAAATP
jgi:mono/diheme cytochrome c family protein